MFRLGDRGEPNGSQVVVAVKYPVPTHPSIGRIQAHVPQQLFTGAKLFTGARRRATRPHTHTHSPLRSGPLNPRIQTQHACATHAHTHTHIVRSVLVRGAETYIHASARAHVPHQLFPIRHRLFPCVCAQFTSGSVMRTDSLQTLAADCYRHSLFTGDGDHKSYAPAHGRHQPSTRTCNNHWFLSTGDTEERP